MALTAACCSHRAVVRHACLSSVRRTTETVSRFFFDCSERFRAQALLLCRVQRAPEMIQRQRAPHTFPMQNLRLVTLARKLLMSTRDERRQKRDVDSAQVVRVVRW